MTCRRLVNSGDPAGTLFMELFRKSYPKDQWDEIYSAIADLCLYEREMGWCFSEIIALIDGFKKLDATNPYDNGYTFADVWSGEILNKDTDSVVMLLVNNSYGVKSIVKVVEIQEKVCQEFSENGFFDSAALRSE